METRVAGPLLLPERIRTSQDLLSRGQRHVARFSLSQPRAASGLAAVRVGPQVEVSESAVLGLARRLGYAGFPELRAAIRETLTPEQGVPPTSYFDSGPRPPRPNRFRRCPQPR